MHEKSPENYDDMMRKILKHECGNGETDEYAADTLELMSEYAEDNEFDEDDEFAEDIGIGKSKYFSTCDYTMINRDGDDTVNYQGS